MELSLGQALLFIFLVLPLNLLGLHMRVYILGLPVLPRAHARLYAFASGRTELGSGPSMTSILLQVDLPSRDS